MVSSAPLQANTTSQTNLGYIIWWVIFGNGNPTGTIGRILPKCLKRTREVLITVLQRAFVAALTCVTILTAIDIGSLREVRIPQTAQQVILDSDVLRTRAGATDLELIKQVYGNLTKIPVNRN